MKFIAKLLLGVGVIFGAFFLISELDPKKPSEGIIEIEDMNEERDVEIVIVVNDEVVVDIDSSEDAEEVVEEVVEEFIPLTIGKSLKKFAKRNNTEVVKLNDLVRKYIMDLSGLDIRKGVKIDGDLYFRSGGKNYVIHKGELFIIN